MKDCEQHPVDKLRNGYHRPIILHKGALKQFAGSPLGRPGWDPLSLPKR